MYRGVKLQDTNRSLCHRCTEAEAESGRTVAAKNALQIRKVHLRIELERRSVELVDLQRTSTSLNTTCCPNIRYTCGLSYMDGHFPHHIHSVHAAIHDTFTVGSKQKTRRTMEEDCCCIESISGHVGYETPCSVPSNIIACLCASRRGYTKTGWSQSADGERPRAGSRGCRRSRRGAMSALPAPSKVRGAVNTAFEKRWIPNMPMQCDG